MPADDKTEKQSGASTSATPEVDSSKELTQEALIANLKAAAQTSKETKDYMTYATLLDVYLEYSYKEFTDEEKENVLNALLEILNADDELVYAISWDVPSRVLPFLRTNLYDFGAGIVSSRGLKTVLDIFKVLADKGNLKELVVKCLEELDKLQFEPLAENDSRPEVVVERFFELKFASLYGLLVSSIKNVKARYPSRFLVAATTGLLSFLVDRVESFSIRTTSFVLRRFYFFARDYSPAPPDDGEVSENEAMLQDKILKKFLIDTFALGLQTHSLKWGQKLLIQLRKGVAFDADAEKRDSSYHTGQYGIDLAEVVQKLCQLAEPLKIDVDAEFKALVDKIINEEAESDDDDKTATEDDPKADDEWGLEDESEAADTLHDEGIFILATTTRFNDRQNPKILKLTFPELIKVTKHFIVGSDQDPAEGSVGLYDALSFWALWTTRTLTNEQVKTQVPKDVFISYVQMLMYLAESTDDESQEQLLFSIIARLLGLHTLKTRIEYLLDTAEFCPYPKVRETTIKLLAQALAKHEIKLTLVPTTANTSGNDELTESVSNLSIEEGKLPTYLFTGEQITRVSNAALEQLTEIESLGADGARAGLLGPDFKVLLALICFLAEISKTVATEAIIKSNELTERCLKYLSVVEALLAAKAQSDGGAAKTGEEENEQQEETKQIEMRKQLLLTALAGLELEEVGTASK
jgi:hypothetical protein